MRGIDFESINGLNSSGDGEAFLLSSDVVTVLDALGDLGVDTDTVPPYAVDDVVSFLHGNNWIVGKVAAIEPTNLRGQWSVTVRLDSTLYRAGSIVRAVNSKGVGGGVAPIREH
jgi:hypothetical protein